mgnify:FL=1|tara:strand:+ start:1154 stop:1741 length:588 start_codon:yes stop_codon:yes gene_type:complete
MKVNIKSNIKKVTKGLTKTQKKQIPFATANAINKTLFQLRKEMAKQTEKKLDRPTPFTQKGFLVDKAKKNKLTGVLFIKEAVEKYLKFQIDGGVRSGNPFVSIPTRNKKLNKYGNISGKRSGIVKGRNQFIGEIKGIRGVWQRQADNQVKLMIAFDNSVSYEPKFPFYKIASKFADSKFNKNLIEKLTAALKSSK